MKCLQPTCAKKISALLGALAIALGAFGAHALNDRLIETGRLEIWKTASLYHLVHAVLLFLIASLGNWKKGPWLLLFSGTLIFSGSLYLLCLTPFNWLGAITPIGGTLLIIGWLSLAFHADN